MTTERRQYTAEFKREAVELSETSDCPEVSEIRVLQH